MTHARHTTTRRKPTDTALALWTLALVLCLGGCLPDRLDQVDAATVVPADDAVDDAQDTTATTADAKGDTGKDASDAVTDDVPPVDVPLLGCKKSEDCAPLGDPCRSATCNVASGLCEVVTLPDATTCATSNALCVVESRCKGGTCQTVPLNCADSNPCTDDTCDPNTGCQHPIKAATCGKDGKQPCLCDDGDACTINDVCDAGACAGATKGACDDFNPCTTDACSNHTCTHTPLDDASACDDGHWCTDNDGCKAGVCAGTPKVCDAPGPCFLAVCADELKTCALAPMVGKTCNDGDPCTTGDACDETGTCVGPKGCDDANPCTDDACVGGQCVSTNNADGCTDPAKCITFGGQCAGGSCALNGVDPCNDGNTCTDDACDATKSVCGHTNNASSCSDGNPCTNGDACDGGSCTSANLEYDDGNECTTDACDPATGSSYTWRANGTPCTGGTCIAGSCAPSGTCGDGVCSLSETSGNCAADCPASGGICAAATGPCVHNCKGCTVLRSVCDVFSDPGQCGDIDTCEAACTDGACRLACLLGKEPLQVQFWLNVHACETAFCVPDSWIGKKCGSADPTFATCTDSCEGALCLKESATCANTSGCGAQRTCLATCGNDSVCLAGCTAPTSADLAAKALLTCSNLYCQ